MKTPNLPKCSGCMYHATKRNYRYANPPVFHYCVNPRQEDGVSARLLRSKSSTSKELGYKTSPFWCPRRK